MNFDSYFDLVTEFVEHTRADLIFQRFLAEAPSQLLIAPHYHGIRNHKFVHLLEGRLRDRKSGQGKLFGTRKVAEYTGHQTGLKPETSERTVHA